MKINLTILAMFLLSINNTYADDESVSKYAYDECILKHMIGVTNEYAAKKISESCSNIHSPNWEDAGSFEKLSSYTEDNHDKKDKYVTCSSSLRSWDGKFCASRVVISIDLNEIKKKDQSYSYRFKLNQPNACPVTLRNGKNGWYHIDSCVFSDDKTKFNASIRGWTSPQQFGVIIPIEKKRK